MRREIEKAIRETLVISNKESVHIAVDKIQKVLLEALEREVISSWLESVKESFRQEGRVCDDEFLGLAKNDAKRYYETELKPKYNPEN